MEALRATSLWRGLNPALPPRDEHPFERGIGSGSRPWRCSGLQGLKPFVYCATAERLKPRPPKESPENPHPVKAG